MKKDKQAKRATKSSISMLIRYISQHVSAIVWSVLLAVVSAAAVLLDPYLRGKVMDGILGGISGEALIDTKTVGMMCLICILLQFVKFYVDQKQNKLLIGVSTSVTRDMRKDLDEKLDKLPMNFFFKNQSGDTLARVVNDTEIVGHNLASIVMYVVSGVILLIAVLVLMFVTNVYLALVCIISTLAGSCLMLVVSKISTSFYMKLAAITGGMNAYIEENFSNHNIVAAYNHQESSKHEFAGINNPMQKASFNAQFIGGLGTPISSFTSYFSTLLIFIVGVKMIIAGSCTIGTVVAFTSYNSALGGPINNIANSIQIISNMGASLKRIYEMLMEKELDPEDDKAPDTGETRGEVVFDSIKFGYDPYKLIIKNFSLNVQPGQTIAIVGPTGAGKTTLVNLLMRFYEVNGGKILVDGVDIMSITREDLRDKVSMVLQDPWVFDGTLLENLTFGTKDAPMEKVERAITAVGLDYYINTLPEKLNTMLGDKMQLSQGQKQQISIARAMIADKPMVILDEATSSIDTRTEKKIQEAMNKLMEGRTSFVIAHRLSTIRNADVILVLKDGDVVEQGSHDALIAKGGFYYELYNSQFDPATRSLEKSGSKSGSKSKSGS